VTGLAGIGLVLQLNGSMELPVASNGIFAFSGTFDEGSPYAVAVRSRPQTPSQTCTVTPPASAAINANVVVQVSCVTDTFAVNVAVTGVAGSGVTLQLNGGASLTATASGTSAFSTRLQEGASYAVTVLSQPVNASQECTVTAPSGTMAAAAITLAVVCLNTYTLSGTVAGLSITRARSALVLTESGRQEASIRSDGSFQFANRIPVGRAYSVTVKSAPGNPEMTCVVTAGAGSMPDADLNTISASCLRSPGRFAYMVRFPGAVLGTTLDNDGNLNSIESLALGYLPQSITVDPSAQFLYAGSGFSSTATMLSSFRINATTGKLTPIGTEIANNFGQNTLAAEPQGRFLFASNEHGGTTNQGSISVYAIDAQTGQLAEAPGSPYNALTNPYGIAFDATGRYVYTTGDQLRGFSIDQVSGALSPLSVSPIAGVAGARRLISTADGRFLYVMGQTGSTLYLKGFRMQPDGGLLEFPISYTPADIDQYLAIDPKGRFLAIAASDFVGSVKISVYAIDPANGTLSRVSTSPDWVTGSLAFPMPMAFDPSGTWLFISSVAGAYSPTPGTATFTVGTADAPQFRVNPYAFGSGDVRAIAIR
jgi:6-phosphogluconolactonase (cycloisomerase 2 family)